MNIPRRIIAHSRTYRIRTGYGVFAIRNKREAKALYEFCREWLAERSGTREYEINRDRVEIFHNTIALYLHQFENRPGGEFSLRCRCDRCRGETHEGRYMGSGEGYYNFYDYVNDHAGWYWS